MKKNLRKVKNCRLQQYLKAVIVIKLLFVSLHVSAQQTTVSLNLTNVTVEEALNAIKSQTQINIIYNHEQLKNTQRINVNINNLDTEAAVSKCLQNTNLEYKKVNNTIVITPKPTIENNVSEKKTQTIRGRVLDAESKSPLAYATVFIPNSNNQGTLTDDEGYFKFEDMPIGRYSLEVSFIGYETGVLSEVLLGSAKEVVLTIELTEQANVTDAVVITTKKGEPKNLMSNLSAKSFSVEETKRYAASISDPARMVQSFAGVSSSDDASNEIVIRGNSPNWLLWQLEGVEIPSPNHFAEEGYSSGAVSILSTNMLGKSDFYMGAFSAEYGNALSGVFDLSLRNGNNEENEYSMQVGLLGAEVAAEGPIKEGYRGSYLFNYRYSTFSILNDLNIQVSENTLPNYQDGAFNIFLPTKKVGNFSIWGIGGNSNTDEVFLPDTAMEQKFEWGYSDNTKTRMYASGISHISYLDKKSYVKSVFAITNSGSSNDVGMMDTLGVMNDTYKDELQSGAIRFNTFYNRKISSKLTARAGGNISQLNFNYFTALAKEPNDWKVVIDKTGKTNMYQSYIQSKYKASEKVEITTGLHFSHFALSSHSSLEPRFGIQYNMKKRQKLGFAYGIHSKNENLPVYFVEFENPDGSFLELNKNLKMTKSSHYIMSYQKKFAKHMDFKTEIYFQSISELPVPNNPDKLFVPAFNGVSPEDTLVNKGEGRNYGLEFTLQKFFTNGYYYTVTSSLFESKYKPLDNNWYNTRYNINYVNNFVGGKEIKLGEDKMLSLNGKILWSGGKRYIPIDLDASREEGHTVFKLDEMYSQKTKDYFRLDIGVKYHIFRPKVEHIISLDIQNVTNRINSMLKIYDSEADKIIDYPMAGLIPILNYRIEF